MKKWIVIALFAGLAACSSNTSDKTAPPETPAPAAQPAPDVPPVPEPPPAPAATETPKEAPKDTAKAAPKAAAATADKAAPKADTKPANKPDAPTNKKPGVYAHFETSMGNFTAELNEKEAPITVANFTGLASGQKEWTDPKTGQKQKKPYYNGLIFHRVIGPPKAPPAGFMIQGGDPLGNGMGGPGFTIKDEYNNLKHDKTGTLAMARTMAPDSAGSQFYLTVTATPFLDGQRPPYVVFGYVTEGLDIIKSIGNVPTDPNDRPLTPVIITKITIERVK